MSPASKRENSEPQEPEAPAEVTEPVAAEGTQPEAADVTASAAEAAAKAAEAAKAASEAAEAAAGAAEAAAEAAEAEPAEAGEVKESAEARPARRRSAAAAGEQAKPAARRTTAKTPAKKAKPAAVSTEVKVDLPPEIFDTKVNVPLIHQVVVAQQAAARQGTHAVKTRGDVRGGGRKPYRQKGTGRARQGSIRAPQFTGGGTVHGPVPRSHVQKTPKKMKAAALRGALSDRARHGLVQVVEGFVDGSEPKTRDALSVLSVVTGTAAGTSAVLVVAESSDHVTWKSLRNAHGVHLIDPGQLNTYDVLVNDRVVFTSGAFASFVARAAAGRQEEQ